MYSVQMKPLNQDLLIKHKDPLHLIHQQFQTLNKNINFNYAYT